MATITWLGHSAFLIEDQGLRLLIDPFLTGNPKATTTAEQMHDIDVVLVTHDHGDHVGQAVDICKRTGAKLAAVVGTAEKFIAAGVPQEQVFIGIGFNMGGTVEHKGVRITMVPAFHTSESGLPVGYILTLPSGTVVYHAGDTCLFGDMALWGELYTINVALLPVGGVFTMDAVQAAKACALLQTPKVIPMHWGTFPVLAQDTKAFHAELQKTAPRCQCFDANVGQAIDI